MGGTLRGSFLGFVLQSPTLLHELTAWENVALPLRILGLARDRAGEMLQLVGLGGREKAMPWELSGGEQQRVAIARALVTRPKFLLADEPTGSLDGTTGGRIGELLFDLCQQCGTGVLVATHNSLFLPHADRSYFLKDGCLLSPAPGR
jgi:predicted ABC-type transport system involved in lysophospholipase L1 biosynthesis ATPase subunit